MFDMFRKVWKIGTVTQKQPFDSAPKKYRGKLVLTAVPNTNWEACIAACPTGALYKQGDKICLFHGNCIMCGQCVKVCQTDAIVQTTDCYLAAMSKTDLFVSVDKDPVQ